MHPRRLGLVGLGLGALSLVAVGTGCLEPGANTLIGVTASDRQTIDTVSFTFFDKLPATSTAGFVGTTPPSGPSGTPVQCDGKTFVAVTLVSAQAHDQRSQATAQRAVYAKDLFSVAEVCQVEDFEGHVQYAIGLSTTKAPKLMVLRGNNVVQVVITPT